MPERLILVFLGSTSRQQCSRAFLLCVILKPRCSRIVFNELVKWCKLKKELREFCPIRGWQGKQSDSGQLELFSYTLETSAPALIILYHPVVSHHLFSSRSLPKKHQLSLVMELALCLPMAQCWCFKVFLGSPPLHYLVPYKGLTFYQGYLWTLHFLLILANFIWLGLMPPLCLAWPLVKKKQDDVLLFFSQLVSRGEVPNSICSALQHNSLLTPSSSLSLL